MSDQQLQRSQAALLRLARLLSEDSDETELLTRVVEEAVALIGGDRGHIRRWDPEQEVLRAVAVMPRGRQLGFQVVSLGQGHSGQTALEDAPLLLDDYRAQHRPNATSARTEAGSGVAVPLRVGKRLLGTLAVGSSHPDLILTEDNVRTITMLGSLAAAALIGQERARLDGALLAARTAAHELNNKLALTVGYAELASQQPGLTTTTTEMLGEALRGAQSAATAVARLQRVVRLDEAATETSGGAVLDLDRSSTRTPGG